MYGYDPGYDLHDTYQELADLAIKHHVKMEDNTGSHYRYHHPDIGLNDDFRNILKEKTSRSSVPAMPTILKMSHVSSNY